MQIYAREKREGNRPLRLDGDLVFSGALRGCFSTAREARWGVGQVKI